MANRQRTSPDKTVWKDQDIGGTAVHEVFNQSVMEMLQKHCGPYTGVVFRRRGKKIEVFPGRRITSSQVKASPTIGIGTSAGSGTITTSSGSGITSSTGTDKGTGTGTGKTSLILLYDYG